MMQPVGGASHSSARVLPHGLVQPVTFAEAQSAWSLPLLPRSSTTRRSWFTPVTSTLTGSGVLLPVTVGDFHKDFPSPMTSNVTSPRSPTSSSTPTIAVKDSQPLRVTVTDESACVPRPLACSVPPTVSGRPSPAACSPLDMSRSTGPHPLVLASKFMSLIHCSPATGGGTGRPTKRTSSDERVAPPWV